LAAPPFARGEHPTADSSQQVVFGELLQFP
jgi:hypothetical protein